MLFTGLKLAGLQRVLYFLALGPISKAVKAHVLFSEPCERAQLPMSYSNLTHKILEFNFKLIESNSSSSSSLSSRVRKLQYLARVAWEINRAFLFLLIEFNSSLSM